MKNNNKRPLISCIAFVCKNAKSAKKNNNDFMGERK